MVRRSLPLLVLALGVASYASACSSDDNPATPPTDGGTDAGVDASTCTAEPCPASKINHVVVIVQENHTFDNHFGRYCTAATGSKPTCNEGPACCEAGPATDAASGSLPTELTDKENGEYDPDHRKACELDEINGGKMDKFVTSTVCGNARNVAYTAPSVIKPLWDLAAAGAIADRYFQPVAGQSSSNNMYFSRAQWVFDNNTYPTDAIGVKCVALATKLDTYTDTTLGDLLTAKGVKWSWYAEGYDLMKNAGGACPDPPADCAAGIRGYPCTFDPGDIPIEYYATTRDNPAVMQDMTKFLSDVSGGTLPAVSFLKTLGYKSEHPNNGATITAGMTFISSIVNAIQSSKLASDTLLIVTYDEGGGYYDHIATPEINPVDNQPYGTRVPMVAVGPFAKKNFVSHVVMEHSSIVKFIEWNWLGQQTGQLNGRDKTIANIGSLLDEKATGVKVPED